jgi:hypothetical protein
MHSCWTSAGVEELASITGYLADDDTQMEMNEVVMALTCNLGYEQRRGLQTAVSAPCPQRPAITVNYAVISAVAAFVTSSS